MQKILIDELGMVQAQIAELREMEKELKAQVKGELFASGQTSLEGELFRATYVSSMRKTVNWEKIARDLGATNRKIAANTKQTEVASLRMYARKSRAA